VAAVKLETVLSYVPLFRGLSKRQLKHLASRCEVADYMQGATIVKEGTDGDAFYVVLKGQAVVTMGGRFVARLVPGDHFGEIALLRDVPRTATVLAATDVELFALDRVPFLEAISGQHLSTARAHAVAGERQPATPPEDPDSP